MDVLQRQIELGVQAKGLNYVADMASQVERLGQVLNVLKASYAGGFINAEDFARDAKDILGRISELEAGFQALGRAGTDVGALAGRLNALGVPIDAVTGQVRAFAEEARKAAQVVAQNLDAAKGQVELGVQARGLDYVRDTIGQYQALKARLEGIGKLFSSGAIDEDRFHVEATKVQQDIALLESRFRAIAAAKVNVLPLESDLKAVGYQVSYVTGALDLTEKQMGRTATAAGRLGSAMNSVGDSQRRVLSGLRAALEFSRAFEDITTAGPIGALNNVPTMFYSIGEALGWSTGKVLGWTTAISGAATLAYILYKNWENLQDALGIGIPTPARQGLEGLEDQLKKTTKAVGELREQKRLTDDELAQLRSLEALETKLKKMVQNAEAWRDLAKTKTSLESETEDRAQDAIRWLKEHGVSEKQAEDLLSKAIRDMGDDELKAAAKKAQDAAKAAREVADRIARENSGASALGAVVLGGAGSEAFNKVNRSEADAQALEKAAAEASAKLAKAEADARSNATQALGLWARGQAGSREWIMDVIKLVADRTGTDPRDNPLFQAARFFGAQTEAQKIKNQALQEQAERWKAADQTAFQSKVDETVERITKGPAKKIGEDTVNGLISLSQAQDALFKEVEAQLPDLSDKPDEQYRVLEQLKTAAKKAGEDLLKEQAKEAAEQVNIGMKDGLTKAFAAGRIDEAGVQNAVTQAVRAKAPNLALNSELLTDTIEKLVDGITDTVQAEQGRLLALGFTMDEIRARAQAEEAKDREEANRQRAAQGFEAFGGLAYNIARRFNPAMGNLTPQQREQMGADMSAHFTDIGLDGEAQRKIAESLNRSKSGTASQIIVPQAVQQLIEAGVDEKTAWEQVPEILKQAAGNQYRAQVATQRIIQQLLLQNQQLMIRQQALDMQSQQMLEAAQFTTQQLRGLNNRGTGQFRGGPR